jgi:hypothetical protein
MSETKQGTKQEQGVRTITYIHSVLLTIMVTLVAVSIVQIGEYVVPSWDGRYLIILGFLVSLEAQYSYRRFANQGWTSEHVLYRVAEWVSIIVVIKLIIYGLRGFDLFLIEARLWMDSFFNNFFSGEFLISLLVILMLWGLSTYLSSKLYQFEGDEEILAVERTGSVAVHRAQEREVMAIIILIVGVVMTSAAAFVFLTQRTGLFGTREVPFGIVPVVAYFILGLALLSVTQYSILRVHWVMDRIPFNANLATRWLAYSLGLLLIVGFVAMLLPTNYTISILDFLNTLLSVVLLILWLIAFILMLPIAFLISLILRLGGSRDGEPPPEMANFLPKAPEQIGPAAGWVEWVKTFLFWSVFIGIILFSVIYYIRQNKQLVSKIKSFRIITGIKLLLDKIKFFFIGANRGIRAIVQEQIQRYQSRHKTTSGSRFGFLNPKRLDPKQQVYYYYLAMIRRGQESGLPREPSQSPDEYVKYIQEKIMVDDSNFLNLTDQFKEARYTSHPISLKNADSAHRAWDEIRKVLRKISRDRHAQ